MHTSPAISGNLKAQMDAHPEDTKEKLAQVISAIEKYIDFNNYSLDNLEIKDWRGTAKSCSFTTVKKIKIFYTFTNNSIHIRILKDL